MKTKNIAIIILAALLAVASVLAAMWYPAGNDEDTTEASGQPDEIMKYRMANELLISNAKAHYTYEGTKLDDFTITAIPSGEQALFSSILDGRYRLVFKTSPLNCQACINAELGNIERFAKRIGGGNRITILVEGSSTREIQAFMKNRNLGINVYKVPKGAMNGMLIKENTPFLCLVDSSMRADQVFVPIKEIPVFAGCYYNNIYERFFKSE